MTLGCLQVAVSIIFEMMALANLLRRGGHHQAPCTLLSMMEHKMDLCVEQV